MGTKPVRRSLELFSGLGILSDELKRRGWETTTVDLDGADINADILDLEYRQWLPGRFQFIWASPPCTTFSIASVRWHWKEREPASEAAQRGMALLERTLEIIDYLQPDYYLIENPRGMMRTVPAMLDRPRRTVTYCQYGAQMQKPTDLWGNLEIEARMCRPGDPCHENAPRGSGRKAGLQKIREGPARSALPVGLVAEIARKLDEQAIRTP